MKGIQAKYNQLLTFDGKIKNYDEMKTLVFKLIDSKPKGKESEEATKKLKEHFNQQTNDIKKDNIVLLDNKDKDKEKGSFFSRMFKK